MWIRPSFFTAFTTDRTPHLSRIPKRNRSKKISILEERRGGRE